MTFNKISLAAAVLVLSVSCALAQVATAPATAPSGPSVPASVMAEMDQQTARASEATSEREQMDLLDEAAAKVIELGVAAEKKYFDAPNLYQVQMKMLGAADYLARRKQSKEYQQQVVDIGKRIVAGKAPIGSKLQADIALTAVKVVPLPGKEAPATASADIVALVNRYKETEVASMANVYGVLLAMQARQGQVQKQLIAALKKDYGDDKQVKEFLRSIGALPSDSPHIGKPFEAKLTTLDGKELNLPEDLKGKVVLIDFWATWCGPCIAGIPEVKQVYAKYKDKGFEIVGISLDREDQKDKLAQFVKDRGMDWIHTYTGKGWEDPTAGKYGIRSIPSLWLVGRDGKVITDNA